MVVPFSPDLLLEEFEMTYQQLVDLHSAVRLAELEVAGLAQQDAEHRLREAKFALYEATHPEPEETFNFDAGPNDYSI